ncbi:zinc-binding dehydrogenase [Paenibacillus sp. 1P07SE]|uniref:zinc-binding dehydrogenase n=1 Tax=Paenibacillus sp. 1P07SE TaxID=3132209 RepID=UPI0039A41B13
MKAILHERYSGLKGLRYADVSVSNHPKPGEVQVRLKAAGINHRDLFVMAARTASNKPLILGSDGAGIVAKIGKGVSRLQVGDEVILHPTLGWNTAADVPLIPQIVGGPGEGTLAEYITLPADNVLPKPSHLSWEEAGVLSLSALTAYRALFTRGQLRQGEHVLIPGIGGGVATFALLFAKSAGATVSVTSRSEAKRAAAARLGAGHALDSHGNWSEALSPQSVDLIMDSIGQDMFAKYFDVLRPGGRVVMYGASSGDDLQVPIRSIFFPQISLLGTSMGSREEFVQMLEWIQRHQIRPVVDSIYQLHDVSRAFERMSQGLQFGNIAIRIEQGETAIAVLWRRR